MCCVYCPEADIACCVYCPEICCLDTVTVASAAIVFDAAIVVVQSVYKRGFVAVVGAFVTSLKPVKLVDQMKIASTSYKQVSVTKDGKTRGHSAVDTSWCPLSARKYRLNKYIFVCD